MLYYLAGILRFTSYLVALIGPSGFLLVYIFRFSCIYIGRGGIDGRDRGSPP